MRVVIVGAISYMAGLLWMALVIQPTLFIIGSGVFIGLALACTAFGAISGIVGRSAPSEQRSWAFGISSAAGSFGQFLMMPVEQQLISAVGWQCAFYVLAALVVAAMVPTAFYLRAPPVTHGDGPQQSVASAFGEAIGNRSFWLLLAGYFVCGFQLVFIGVHLPAYLKEQGLSNPNIAVTALALIGLFNIIGSYYAGKLGGKIAKRHLLSAIYVSRAALITLFLLASLAAWPVYIFAAGMGVLWLSIVPLTNGIIARMFGVKHLSHDGYAAHLAMACDRRCTAGRDFYGLSAARLHVRSGEAPLAVYVMNGRTVW